MPSCQCASVLRQELAEFKLDITQHITRILEEKLSAGFSPLIAHSSVANFPPRGVILDLADGHELEAADACNPPAAQLPSPNRPSCTLPSFALSTAQGFDGPLLAASAALDAHEPATCEPAPPGPPEDHLAQQSPVESQQPPATTATGGEDRADAGGGSGTSPMPPATYDPLGSVAEDEAPPVPHKRQLHASPSFVRKKQIAALLGAGPSQMWRASSKRALLTAKSGSSAVASGSRTAFRRAKALLWDILQPTSPLRVYWDILMVFVLLWVCIIIPYMICFDIVLSHGHRGLYVADITVNVLFLLDMYLNTRTAFLGPDGKYETGRLAILKDYARGWLVVDMMSMLPYDSLMHYKAGALFKVMKASRIMRFIRMARLLKVVKMLHLPRVLKQLEELIGRAVLSMTSFIVIGVLLIHWMACIFWFVGSLEHHQGDSWILRYNLLHASDSAQYINALYWSVTTMSTVGFGDLVPVNYREKIVAMFGMILGATMISYLMAAMANVVSTMNTVNARMSRKRQVVDEFLKHRKVPLVLANRVRSFYSYVVEREVHSDESDIISGLPGALKNDIVMHLYRRAVEKVPLFRNKRPQFITAIVTCLHLEYYAPGDIIVMQGEIGQDMYFISEGSLEVRIYTNADTILEVDPLSSVAAGKGGWLSWLGAGASRTFAIASKPPESPAAAPLFRKVGLLKPGQYFGEYACLMGTARTATVVATEYCELYSLSRSDLEAVMQRFPELAVDLNILTGAKGIVLKPAAAQDAGNETAAEQPSEVEDAAAPGADDDPYQRFKAVVETIAQESSPEEGPDRPAAQAQGPSPTGRQDSVLFRRSATPMGLAGQALEHRSDFKIPAVADPAAAERSSAPTPPSSHAQLWRQLSSGDAAAGGPSRFSFSVRDAFGSAGSSATHWERERDRDRRVSQTFQSTESNLFIPNHRRMSLTILGDGMLLQPQRRVSQTVVGEGNLPQNDRRGWQTGVGEDNLPQNSRRVSQTRVVEAPLVPQQAAVEPPVLLRREDI